MRLLFILPALLALPFKACVQETSLVRQQRSPGWVSAQTDGLLRRLAQALLEDLQARRKRAVGPVKRAIVAGNADFLDLPSDELATSGNYGRLPEVMVDRGVGAVFPKPIEKPARFSWLQVAMRARQAHLSLRRVERGLARGGRDVSELVTHWNAFNDQLSQALQEWRYLDAWLPQLQAQWRELQGAGRRPGPAVLVEAILSQDAKMMTVLRDLLRPRRVLPRAFLPDTLEGHRSKKPIDLPITTDVVDPRFLREVEGSLDTHWNQSPWAKRERISFRISWKRIAVNRRFRERREGLSEHLLRFPETSASMTTGGLTTYVKGSTLILGPGKILPRTLAHEIGHLLGFGDCYLRTLSGQGLLGSAVLEWDNPLYPDDIMCDNGVGVARAEAW